MNNIYQKIIAKLNRVRTIRLAMTFSGFLVRSIIRHQTLMFASALAFKTLLSTVPLMLIGMAILMTFGSEHGVSYADSFLDAVEERIPQIPALTPLLNLLRELATRPQEIFGLGFLSLFYLAYSLLSSVEWCFNFIWHAHRHRPFFRQLFAYLLVVLFVPILMSFSVYFNLEITSLVGKAEIYAQDVGNTLWNIAADSPPILVEQTTSLISRGALSALSLTITCISLTLMMYLMPYTRVRVKAALCGGIVSGMLIEATHYGFGLYTNYATENLTHLYGSTLLFFPLTLLWIWLTWAFILVGAEVAHTQQNYRKFL